MSNCLGFTHGFLCSSKCLGRFFSSALCCSTHSLSSSYGWLLHCCCSPLWSSWSTGIPKTAGVPCCNWAALWPIAFSGPSSGTPVLPYNAKPQLLPMAPSHLQNQHLQLPAQGTTSAMFGTQLLCADSQEMLSRRLLIDAGSLLSITNFSASTN